MTLFFSYKGSLTLSLSLSSVVETLSCFGTTPWPVIHQARYPSEQSSTVETVHYKTSSTPQSWTGQDQNQERGQLQHRPS